MVGGECWQDWTFDGIAGLLKKASSRVVDFESLLNSAWTAAKATQVMSQYDNSQRSHQRLSIITPHKSASSYGEEDLERQLASLSLSKVALEETLAQLQVRYTNLESELQSHITHLLYNYYFSLRISHDEANNYSIEMTKIIQPNGELVDFRKPRVTSIQLADDFDDTPLKPMQQYTSQYLHVVIRDLPGDTNDSRDVEIARRKQSIISFSLGLVSQRL